jgi:hypothetical protein
MEIMTFAIELRWLRTGRCSLPALGLSLEANMADILNLSSDLEDKSMLCEVWKL